jgi:peptidoglycan/xylan/chitin deacetylase (PgdA/CDA1 family)
MIGVAVGESDWDVVAEFFELFKTPWQPVKPSSSYKAVLATEPPASNIRADIVLAYGSRAWSIDRDAGVGVEPVNGPARLEWEGCTVPIYGDAGTFSDASSAIVRAGGKSIDCRYNSGTRVVRRIGYDIFKEVRYLLTSGQPSSNALVPALEIHIALLRSLLIESNVSFVEIPPSPDGHPYICCLTHDVDFFGIRRHMFDRTLAGFIGRASVGTLVGLVHGVRTPREAIRNLAALVSLPLVFLGLRRDFWQPFEDYRKVDAGRPATFFVVPFKGRPGVAPDGSTDSARAVKYEIADVRHEVRAAAAGGSELGVHGIDAWRDAAAGRSELDQLTSATGQHAAGVRMHWLYFGADSPRELQAAGFDYDSTCGYNDAVGYRAGTSQAFRLPGAGDLMELPLSIMDTALFYPSRMGLNYAAAWAVCEQILENAKRWNGTVVVNWHCRSLAPERLWGRFYEQLLRAIGDDGAWFATASEAVAWFRWRRTIQFTGETLGSITVSARAGSPGPSAQVVLHRPRAGNGETRMAFDGTRPMAVVA